MSYIICVLLLVLIAFYFQKIETYQILDSSPSDEIQKSHQSRIVQQLPHVCGNEINQLTLVSGKNRMPLYPQKVWQNC